MSEKNSEEFDDIDEAEEEALLKSDDENVDAGDSQLLDNVNDSSNSGESDDFDDNEEKKIITEYTNILQEVKENEYAYDKYIRLCELSHLTGDLANIRNSYQLFSSIYPLTPQLWMKYLQVETDIATSPEELQKVYELYQIALKDYYSTDLALQYTSLASHIHGEDIWFEVLGIYGLHCMKGSIFFNKYRSYIQDAPLPNEEIQNRLVESYLRQLKLPHMNMENTYVEFKAYCYTNKDSIQSQLDWEEIDKKYFKAKEHMEKIVPFENHLVQLDPKCHREKAEIYKNYIKQSDKFLDENVLQTIYERMVADCCLDIDCWLVYIRFLEYRDEFGRPDELQNFGLFKQTAFDVTNRALRNCTWNEKLYVKRLHLLEKMKRPRDEIQKVFESSLTVGFQSAQSSVAIWLAYLGFLRRHTDWEKEDECDKLRKNFSLCWTSLGQHYGVLADCNCEILQFWGRLEYGPLGQPKEGKDLWTTVMESSDNATKSGLWIEFIQLEMRRDLDSTRRLFRKSLNSEGLDNPYVIMSAWERFERCNGNLKNLEDCLKECEDFVAQHWYKQKATYSSGALKSKKPKDTKRKLSSSNDDLPTTSKLEKKRKMNSEQIANEISSPKANAVKSQRQSSDVYKAHENQEIDFSKDHLRIFLSNLDYDLNEDDIRQALPELSIVKIDLIRTLKGRSRGFCYLELENKKEVETALSLDRRILNGRPLYITSVLRDKEKRQAFKYSQRPEPQKLFVKGLPPYVTKEDLTNLFKPFGVLVDVRLVLHKDGKSKGIAYIEYEDELAANKALMTMDDYDLDGNLISVAISAPPAKQVISNADRIASRNLNKLLNQSQPRKVFDQKPRMSFIPAAVRKKQLAIIAGTNAMPPPPSPVVATAATTTTTMTTASATIANGTAASNKTNEDFRKFLKQTF